MRLSKYDLEGKKPSKRAPTERRPVFQKGQWQKADIDEMSRLHPGNEHIGRAVVEAPNTMLFVPEGWRIRSDEHTLDWMDKGGKR